MDDVNKKLRIRKVLKEVVFKTFAECNTTTKEEKLKSAYETLKRKINAVKTIEDEITDISQTMKSLSKILLSKILLSKQNQNWLLWKISEKAAT